MGDPRRTRSKYQGPRHPWNKERIDTEKVLMRTYGLTNKKELWKVGSKLKTYKDNTKKLIAQISEQSEKELSQLFTKLQRLGVAKMDVTADDVLGLEVEQLLDRRLQTVVLKKELARSAKQARQFITHGHILIGDNKVTSPGYLVSVNEESQIMFRPESSLYQDDHPERAIIEKSKPVEVKTDMSKAQEEVPVTKTSEEPEEKKPVEEQIDDETSDKKEVESAIEKAEADKIAEDHEEEVEKEAAA